MTNTRELLNYISPDDYDTWMKVGAALKHEGESLDLYREWSMRSSRYRDGDCEKKWQTFQDEGITGGTIIHIAEKFGYKRARINEWDWDTIISPEDIIEAKSTVRAKKTAKPLTLSEQCEQIKAYLNALFYEDEHVGYCTQTMQRDDGKWTPDLEACVLHRCAVRARWAGTGMSDRMLRFAEKCSLENIIAKVDYIVLPSERKIDPNKPLRRFTARVWRKLLPVRPYLLAIRWRWTGLMARIFPSRREA